MQLNACHVALATQPETNPSCPDWPASQPESPIACTHHPEPYQTCPVWAASQSPTQLALASWPTSTLPDLPHPLLPARALQDLPRHAGWPAPYGTCRSTLAGQNLTQLAPMVRPEPYTTCPHSPARQSPTHLAPAGQTARALPKTCSSQLTSQSPGPLALASQHPT